MKSLTDIVKKNQWLIRETRSRPLLEKLISNGHGGFLFNWENLRRITVKKKQIEDLLTCDRNLKIFFHDYFAKRGFREGLIGYLDMCRQLLKEFRQGQDALESRLSLPPTTDLRDAFKGLSSTQLAMSDKSKIIKAEKLACRHLDKLGFVLVAGGLGERLGSQIAKVSLKVHSLNHPKVPDDTFLGFYFKTIIALQKLYTETTGKIVKIPILIMCSDYNHKDVKKEVKSFYRLGIHARQVTIALQIEAPCIGDLEGNLAMDEGGQFIKKPLGHGFIHALISRLGYLDSPAMKEKEYLFFLQDTNPQSVNVMLSSYGLTRQLNYFMSWVGVERYPGEQAGLIVGQEVVEKRYKKRRVANRKMRQVVNIEYNRLETGMNLPQGQFFANTNNFWIRIREYSQALKCNNGVLPFMVNPKPILDSLSHLSPSKSYKPFRPESLMQDIAYALPMFPEAKPRAGVILYPRHLAFSPLKKSLPSRSTKELVRGDIIYTSLDLEFNNNKGNLEKIQEGNTVISHPARSFYLSHLFKQAPEILVPLFQYPRIVLDPVFKLSQNYVRDHIRGCSFYPQSLLVIKGGEVYLNNVILPEHAALIIYLNSRYRIRLTIENFTVNNRGVSYRPLSNSVKDENEQNRGYRLVWRKPLVIKIDRGGNYRYKKNGLERIK